MGGILGWKMGIPLSLEVRKIQRGRFSQPRCIVRVLDQYQDIPGIAVEQTSC